MPGSSGAEAPARVGTLDRVGAVWDRHRFDADALARWLAARLGGFADGVDVAQFKGGASNPTFLITDPASGARYVLRKKPPGDLLPRTHLIEREHRIMAALGETAVPVPPMLALCEDAAVIGTAFYVMPFLDGRIYKGNRLPDMDATDTRQTYRELARTLATLHAVDSVVVGLGDLGRHGGYFARQLARWSDQYRTTAAEPIASMERLIAVLPGMIPADDPLAISHGDFRIENVLIAPDAPKVRAVLDWELATLGHPLADVAFFCLFYHAGFMPWGEGAVPGRDGIPTEGDFVGDYIAAGGRDPGANWRFYLAFSAFRLGAIALNVEYRVAQGVTTVEPGRGSRGVAFADLAVELLDRA